MKLNIKNIGLGLLAAALAFGNTSCNKFLDLEPINQITPESYYSSADQLATYITNYYNGYLLNPFSGSMFHPTSYNDGMARSDGDTDIMAAGGGNTTLYSNVKHWEVSSGKVLQSYYNAVRIFNYYINTAEANKKDGKISGDATLIDNYIGEGYFFRALTYYRMLALYGDLPIVKEVLQNVDADIIANSKRAPRTEVADFILEDLNTAYKLLCPRSKFNGQRVCREAAALLKSRVALFEATFEKYHKGSGRVPGDANWPGAKMAYNTGKTFDIDAHISSLLDQAMEAAKNAVGSTELTTNNHVLQPVVGVATGWNPYFEMYSQPSLASVPEVLLWKQYNSGVNVSHDAPWRVKTGSNDGFSRAFIESFLTKGGLPWYRVEGRDDSRIYKLKENRDERLQLFIWDENTIYETVAPGARIGEAFGCPPIAASNAETRCITGYQPRKYCTYDASQCVNDQMQGTNACPIFRIAEAMLNYIEANYEKNGNLDATASDYWKKIRRRAGVDEDYSTTIAATDLNQELTWSVYSGGKQVDATLFNIRRERMCETFAEGLRFADLIRWRSFDILLTDHRVVEGVNFWAEMYDDYRDEKGEVVKHDGSPDAIVSGPEQGTYLRPYSRSLAESNELKNGYFWHEAYYLYPIGASDLRTASADRDIATSELYQNIYWPTTAGGQAEK